MTHEEFERFKLDFNTSEDLILKKKGADYSTPEDRLANFKRLKHPLFCWQVLFQKHVDAIHKFCDKGKLESEPIEERIKDARNYLLLLAALISDRLPDD